MVLVQEQRIRRERRRDVRYQIKGRPYVLLGPHSVTTGNLIDLSQGGLAFYYRENPIRLKVHGQVDLFLPGESERFSGAMYLMISDCPVKLANTDGTRRIRRCGVQFLHLSQDQSRHLRAFILQYSLAGA